MATISSLGVGSGLDIGSIVSQLLQAEAAPKTARYDRREVEYQTELTALGNLKSALSGFQSSYSGLLKSSTYKTYSVSSSNENTFKAITAGNISPGAHNIEVKQLAQSQSIASASVVDIDAIIGSGDLVIDFGEYSYDGADVVNGFTKNTSKAGTTLTFTDASMRDIQTAINDADIGITANIINDGSGYRLVMNSNDTGAENAIRVSIANDSDTNDSDAAGISMFGYNPLGEAGPPAYAAVSNMTENLKALNAIVAIDGIDVISDDNSVTGAIENVTLQLKKADPGTIETLTKSITSAGVSAAFEEFIEGYNSLMQAINDVSYYDSDSKKSGPLIGDATVRGVKTRMQGILNTVISGSPLDKYNSFASLGVLTTRDGTLEFDSAKLGKALAENPDQVKRVLLGGELGKRDDLLEFVNIPSSLDEGEIAINISLLSTQGFKVGSTVTAPTRFDLSLGGVYEANVVVDGVDSGLFTVANLDYVTGDALAAALQSSINGTANLQAAGKTVEVAWDAVAETYTVTSGTHGSSSTLDFSYSHANFDSRFKLGASLGWATDGTDMVGTIGGVEATVSGQTLSGNGRYLGVEVNVLGGATGFRDAIRYKEGLFRKLDSLIDSMLSSEGSLAAKQNSINSSIEDINKGREELSLRLSSLEQRYIKQFSAMDALVGQLNSMGSFLQGQLANLPGPRKQSS